jgi:hypothetical protein
MGDHPQETSGEVESNSDDDSHREADDDQADHATHHQLLGGCFEIGDPDDADRTGLFATENEAEDQNENMLEHISD